MRDRGCAIGECLGTYFSDRHFLVPGELGKGHAEARVDLVEYEGALDDGEAL